MGVANDFRERFSGIQFFLVHQNGGVGEFKSDYIVIPEQNVEIFFKIIVSLKDNFTLPNDILIQDIYNASEKIHSITQWQHLPMRTHILYDTTHEKTV